MTLPLIEDIPFVGEIVGTMGLLTWAALLLTCRWWPSTCSARGAACGCARSEKPPATADTVGLPVIRTRYLAVTASGVFAA